MREWEKLGRVFVPDGESEWARSRAYLPTPYLVDAARIRIYLAFLDAHRVGRVGFVDVAADDPVQVLDVAGTPALDIGRPGAFDDRGVTPSSIVRDAGLLRLYYFGWHGTTDDAYTLFSGVAVSDDGGATFSRLTNEPVLGPREGERVCRSAPCVRIEDDWRVWYVSSDSWVEVGGKLRPTYDIRHARSRDGISWSHGSPAVPLAAGEFGLGRPYVRRTEDGYEMWYGVRTEALGYRIGYAKSRDGECWERRDPDAGIEVSQSGWDSEMVAFAAVVETPRATYLFYNGNGYGESGFGVAALVGS
jgi:hypothetical protein